MPDQSGKSPDDQAMKSNKKPAADTTTDNHGQMAKEDLKFSTDSQIGSQIFHKPDGQFKLLDKGKSDETVNASHTAPSAEAKAVPTRAAVDTESSKPQKPSKKRESKAASASKSATDKPKEAGPASSSKGSKTKSTKGKSAETNATHRSNIAAGTKAVTGVATDSRK